MTAYGRFCCKSLFALLIKNSKGYRRDVRVNMWGTSSPDDELVSDLAKATEAVKIAMNPKCWRALVMSGDSDLMRGHRHELHRHVPQEQAIERGIPSVPVHQI